MTILTIIWGCVIVLAAMTFAASAGMVVRRLLRDRDDRRSQQIHQATVDALLNPDRGLRCRFTSLAAARALLSVLTLVRGEARARIVDAALDHGAPQAMCALLRSRALVQRILAAEVLGFFNTDTVRRALGAAAHDRDMRVRTAALQSLLSLGAPLPIADVLRHMESMGARRQSALAGVLRRAVMDRPMEGVRALQHADAGPLAFVALLDALAAARVIDAAPFIITHAQRGDIEVRAAAIHALSALGHPSAGDVIGSALADPDWRIRVRAAEAAGRLGCARLTAPLAQLRNDDIWWVRLRALQALQALGQAPTIAEAEPSARNAA